MRRCWFAVAVALLLPGLLLCQNSTPSYWRYAPADPVLLVGLDWRQAAQSNMSGLIPGGIGKLSANFDFAEEIANVLVAAEPGIKAGKGRFLAIVSGKFNETRLRGMAAAEGVKPTRYRGADLYSSAGTDVAILGGNVLLAGDTASVRASLDRGAAAKPRESAIWRRAAELSSDYTLWVTLPNLDALPGAKPAANPLLSGVKSLDGGIAFHRGMEMAFDVGTATPETAGALAALMQGAAASQAPSVLRDLAVKADGTRVRFSASLDLAQLETGVKAMLAGGAQPQRGLMDWVMRGGQPLQQTAAVDVRPKTSQPVPPPQKRTIRIVGLEEGTREIPYPSNPR
jgi:hypothetical protein